MEVTTTTPLSGTTAAKIPHCIRYYYSYCIRYYYVYRLPHLLPHLLTHSGIYLILQVERQLHYRLLNRFHTILLHGTCLGFDRFTPEDATTLCRRLILDRFADRFTPEDATITFRRSKARLHRFIACS